MAAKILKFWHQWSWAYHVAMAIVVVTTIVVTYKMTAIANASAIESITSQNLPTRVAVLEANNRDVKDQLGRIEDVQGKIFDRINQIADRNH